LDLSATGSELTEYHVEAAIAATHCCAPRAQETDWAKIVWLYNKLTRIRSSPVVALNRAIAIAQLEGPERGLQEIRAIENSDRLAEYPFFFAAIGELELRSGNREAAGNYFRSALAVARNPMERRFLEQRVNTAAASA
jgi:predicted RNA polymerase sigma factor